MSGFTNIIHARGLDKGRKRAVKALIDVYERVNGPNGRNAERRSYFEGHVQPKDIGVSTVPEDVREQIREACDWPRLVVEAVSERSRFEGFEFEDGGFDPSLAEACRDNAIAANYTRFLPSELVHGCMAVTVGKGADGRARVRYHSAENCAMIWDMWADRLDCGLVVADMRRTKWSPNRAVPVQVNMHEPGLVTVFKAVDAVNWTAETRKTPMERPMMEAFRFEADGDNPLGQSRISGAVMAYTNDVLRTLQDMAVSAAFYAAPQKWMVGLNDATFKKLANNPDAKWDTSIGAMLIAALNDEGEPPKLGQFSAASPQPYIDQLRAYAMLASGAARVPADVMGVIHDNPSSAEAIEAARESVCTKAANLNASNGESLRNVALMAMAVEEGKPIGGLSDYQKTVRARFAPTRFYSLAESTDAATKLAQVVPEFPYTVDFWTMRGYDLDAAKRMVSQLTAVRAQAGVTEALSSILEASNTSGGEGLYGEDELDEMDEGLLDGEED